MSKELEKIASQITTFEIHDFESLEHFRNQFLVKKSSLNELFGKLKEIEPEGRKAFGQLLNEVRKKAEEKYEENCIQYGRKKASIPIEMDDTLPTYFIEAGAIHPLNQVKNEIIQIFQRLGFGIEEGPEVEDDWHNFSALNFPQDHPARDMQDTFFVNHADSYALRTHTSSVQVRLLERKNPPLRAIMPGRVYRNEAVSARANCFFHQVEGIYIDKNVTFSDLKATLFAFVKHCFGSETKIRFRPSYFPFTEPSAEMDISCNICGGKGCTICKKTGWVEILGCGMIDPAVMGHCNIEPEQYSGFAFGMGIERITMLKYQVHDLRLFFDNDIRFLSQFRM